MQNTFFFLMGLAVLFLNKLRYGLRGYREPRPFAPTDHARAIAYDQNVVDQWLKALHDYTGETLEGKVVLELGPGADLGPALFLLDRGARKYITVDANRLIDQTPHRFYEELLKRLDHAEEIKPELEKTLAGNDDRIQYVVDSTFDLTKLPREAIDLVVSQAAFEHFDHVEKTINQLGHLVKSGGVLIAEVDTMTHTGALRGRDPLNIYRYSNFLYRLARFDGIPNRLRPARYKSFLEQNGWYNVEILPLQTMTKEDMERIRPQLAKPFRHDDADMQILTFLLRATKR
ncbi:MAG TPA: class I SAM-dependent methyltransferase [Patescibacteria group bacterium]|nr:class I SAM-dependent methyltransferase [Patescibacteria group bacterium]